MIAQHKRPNHLYLDSLLASWQDKLRASYKQLTTYDGRLYSHGHLIGYTLVEGQRVLVSCTFTAPIRRHIHLAKAYAHYLVVCYAEGFRPPGRPCTVPAAPAAWCPQCTGALSANVWVPPDAPGAARCPRCGLRVLPLQPVVAAATRHAE